MDEKSNAKKLALHQQSSSNIIRMNDSTSKENLANLLQSFESLRRTQELSLESLSEESFTSSSCAEKTFSMKPSSLQRETTGGNEIQTGEDKYSSSISNSMMMKTGACAIGKTMFSQQQQKQQSSVVASSSSSSIASSSMEAMRKSKTLSFLHNEDLLETGTTMIAGANSSNSSSHNEEKSLPTTSHLFRSISFQEQRRQYNQKSTLQRTESGKEKGDLSATRKMAILSPKHSLQELNERIKQQQIRMQQQMFYGSSELSM